MTPSAGPRPHGLLGPAPGDTRIAGEYLVTVRPDAVRGDPAQASVEVAGALAGRYGARVQETYHRTGVAFLAGMDAEQAARMAEDPQVEFVEQNAATPAPEELTDERATVATSPRSWGLDRIDQRHLPLDASFSPPAVDTATVTAYVVDSKVYTAHQEFAGRAEFAAEMTDYTDSYVPCKSHGTHVAATVAGRTFGVASAVRIKSLNIDCECPSGGAETGATYSSMKRAAEWIDADAEATGTPAVVNLSYGTRSATIRNSVNRGTVWVVSAGNDDEDDGNRATAALIVAASDEGDTRSPSSGWGPAVDLFAPGDKIWSAGIGSPDATERKSGTSMAAPHVAGAAVLYRAQYPRASAQEVMDAITAQATPDVVQDPKDSPDRLLYVGPR
ncbi:S8 family peptidase [Streptomyces sp. NPDC060053]|uniref:S8 family peptidase n=1 Tax=Streptomyces sp. NPDC060053 TaxID=3347047 RepID=UPI003684721D